MEPQGLDPAKAGGLFGQPSPLQGQQHREGPAPSSPTHASQGPPSPAPMHSSPPTHVLQGPPFFGGGEGQGPQTGLGSHPFGEGGARVSLGTEDEVSHTGIPRFSIIPCPLNSSDPFSLMDFPASATPVLPSSLSRAYFKSCLPHGGGGGGASAAPSFQTRPPRSRARFATSPLPPLPSLLATIPFDLERPRFRREQTPFNREGSASPNKAPGEEFAEEWLRAHVEPSPDQSLSREGLYAHYCQDTDVGASLDPTAFHKIVHTVFPGVSVKRRREKDRPGSFYVGITQRPNPAPLRPNLSGVVGGQTLQKAQSLEPRPFSKIGRGSLPPLLRSSATAPAELQTNWHGGPSSPAGLAPKPFESKRPQEDVHLQRFLEAYHRHLWRFAEAVIKLDFRKAEGCLSFWGDLSPEELGAADQSAALARIRELDEQAHQHILHSLIPDPLLPAPTGTLQDIRYFARSYKSWLAASLSHAPRTLALPRLLDASLFADILKRRASLSYLSGRAASLLSRPEVSRVMLESWENLDCDGIRDQVQWSLAEDGCMFDEFFSNFPRILCTNAPPHEWASWFERFTFNRVDMRTEVFEAFMKSAKRFLLSWTFFGSLLVRDLTLRNPGGFGALHVLKLFLDELLMYVLENRRAQFKRAQPSGTHAVDAFTLGSLPSREPFHRDSEGPSLPPLHLDMQQRPDHRGPSSSSDRPPLHLRRSPQPPLLPKLTLPSPLQHQPGQNLASLLDAQHPPKHSGAQHFSPPFSSSSSNSSPPRSAPRFDPEA